MSSSNSSSSSTSSSGAPAASPDGRSMPWNANDGSLCDCSINTCESLMVTPNLLSMNHTDCTSQIAQHFWPFSTVSRETRSRFMLYASGTKVPSGLVKIFSFIVAG